MNKLTASFAVIAFAALPMMASAVTVIPVTALNVDQSYSFAANSAAGNDGVTFQFEAVDRFKIDSIRLTANGANVTTAQYEVSNPSVGPLSFDLVTTGLGVSVAPGTIYDIGDTFSVFLTESAATPVAFTVSFETAAIPVPAAGLLLLTALGGGAALRRRKKAVAA